VNIGRFADAHAETCHGPRHSGESVMIATTRFAAAEYLDTPARQAVYNAPI
jgi:hypothetical protein